MLNVHKKKSHQKRLWGVITVPCLLHLHPTPLRRLLHLHDCNNKQSDTVTKCVCVCVGGGVLFEEGPYSRGKTLTLTLSRTPPKWIALVLAPKGINQLPTFSHLGTFNISSWLFPVQTHAPVISYKSASKGQVSISLYKTILVWQIRLRLSSCECVETHRVSELVHRASWDGTSPSKHGLTVSHR